MSLRVVSLLPAGTEILSALGAVDLLVGRGHECRYPESIVSLPVVSGSRLPEGELSSAAIDAGVRAASAEGRSLYTIDVAALAECHPDVILTQGLCEVCAIATEDVHLACAEAGIAPTLVELAPTGLDDALASVRTVAEAIGRPEVGDETWRSLRRHLMGVVGGVITQPRRRVAMLEWLDPPFAPGHWLPEQIACAGGEDVLGSPGEPSRRTTLQSVCDARPDVVILAPCGFSTDEAVRHATAARVVAELSETPAGRSGQIYAVDANAYFSCPGPRLVEGIQLLASVLHPTRMTFEDAGAVRRLGSGSVP